MGECYNFTVHSRVYAWMNDNINSDDNYNGGTLIGRSTETIHSLYSLVGWSVGKLTSAVAANTTNRILLVQCEIGSKARVCIFNVAIISFKPVKTEGTLLI